MECWMFVHALQGWNEEWIANYTLRRHNHVFFKSLKT